MITTEHLMIYPATQKQMEAFILAETDSALHPKKFLQNAGLLKMAKSARKDLVTPVSKFCFFINNIYGVNRFVRL